MSESRPNFILLLGLEMSSPITDDAVEEAISRFKTQLTLDEKNPRRAADAAERRRLLTELQRVMRDPSLREREIAAAHTALKSVADDAFAEAQAYASKGFLTPKEFEGAGRIATPPAAFRGRRWRSSAPASGSRSSRMLLSRRNPFPRTCGKRWSDGWRNRISPFIASMIFSGSSRPARRRSCSPA